MLSSELVSRPVRPVMDHKRPAGGWWGSMGGREHEGRRYKEKVLSSLEKKATPADRSWTR